MLGRKVQRQRAARGVAVAALTIGTLLFAGAGSAAAQQRACETVLVNFGGLPAGTVLAEQFAAAGIHMSAIANDGRPNKLVVFDSDASGTPDPDLEVNIGNLAIIPEDDVDGNADGLVDAPSDSIRGGTQIYRFDHPRTVDSFKIVDSDHGAAGSRYARAFDGAGNLIVEVPIGSGPDANVQTIHMNAEQVRRLEITYRDSAGVTDLLLRCTPQGGQGCTPGYWKQEQHFGSWTDPYDPGDPFASFFENAFPGKSLLQVLQAKGGGLQALGRHTVAALLNAAHPALSYPFSEHDVISAFNAAFPGTDAQYEQLKNRFEAENERDCPLGRALTRSAHTTVRAGSRGPSVARLQRVLRVRGYKWVEVTSVFDSATRRAVVRYQRAVGVKPTGVVDPATWRKLLRLG